MPQIRIFSWLVSSIVENQVNDFISSDLCSSVRDINFFFSDGYFIICLSYNFDF